MRKVQSKPKRVKYWWVFFAVCSAIVLFTSILSVWCIKATFCNHTANTPGGHETLARMGVYLATGLTLITSMVYLSRRRKEKMNEIKGFQGSHRFLSNFYPCRLEFGGLTYTSSEAAYQAQKTLDEKLREEFTTLNAREARKKGRQIKIREDWDYENLNVMYRILRIKFTDASLRKMLLDTEGSYLEETNYWHDTFWGVYNGEGWNHLGRLLMIVRDEIKEGII